MGLGNDIATWFTGRNGVYRDSDKVDAAMENLNNIKNSTIETSKETIAEAVNKINACTGFEQYVGHVEGSAFDPVIDYAGLAVDEVMNQIQAKGCIPKYCKCAVAKESVDQAALRKKCQCHHHSSCQVCTYYLMLPSNIKACVFRIYSRENLLRCDNSKNEACNYKHGTYH